MAALIGWLVEALTKKIKSRKTCEYMLSLMSMAISGATLNNTVAIVITAPIAKELGGKYRIAPKRLASIIDIFACAVLCFMPHDSGMLLVQEFGDVSYFEILRYSFYPFLLLAATVITIQFGLMRDKSMGEPQLDQEDTQKTA